MTDAATYVWRFQVAIPEVNQKLLRGLAKSGKIFSSLAVGTPKTLGVAKVADAFGLAGTETAPFAGRTVDAPAVLVNFT